MTRIVLLCCFLAAAAPVALAQNAEQFLGSWELDLPGGGAGWLDVAEEDGYLDGRLLWGGGSVVPVDFVTVDGDSLFVSRSHRVERRNDAGEVVREQRVTDLLQITVDGDALAGNRIAPRRNSRGFDRSEFSGRRTPPLPPAPDLSQVTYGEPISLFNGRDLTGWRLTNENQVNGWSVRDGLLVNDPVQEEGRPRIRYGNLRTEQEFEDFNLTLEVSVPERGNSGVYLRGIYEVQVLDSYGRDPHWYNMGAIYSRIAPSVTVDKAPNEWQTLDITLVDRHVTVILNGVTIIDNQPLEGCTGGALWSDVTRPGPVFLQGDHTGVSYRNIVLRPVIN